VEAEAALGPLGDRLFLGPSLVRHAIQGAHHAGAVRTVKAMDKHRLIGRIGNELQELGYFLVLRMQRIERDPLVLQRQIADLVPVAVELAKRDNHLDSHLRQALHAFFSRLGAAIQRGRNLVKIPHAFALHRRRPAAGRSGCRPGCCITLAVHSADERIAKEIPRTVNTQRREAQQHDS